MQCDETISHKVTAGRSYFRTLRNACVTAGKTTMTPGNICHGCFEMLCWPHRTSANIISTCFWLLETCTKCSYFIEENIRPGTQRLAFELDHSGSRTTTSGLWQSTPSDISKCLASTGQHLVDGEGSPESSNGSSRMVPPPTSNESLTWLQQRFHDRLITRRCDLRWSPHSPDLNPPHFLSVGIP